MSFRQLGKIISVKDEPQTTPSLTRLITKAKARETIDSYKITPALRDHLKRVFERAVHQKGQGFWVQAEYGAGKTHFLGALIDLLIWQHGGVWDAIRDEEIKSEYSSAISKLKLFPVPFSLRGMGRAGGDDSEVPGVWYQGKRDSLHYSSWL